MAMIVALLGVGAASIHFLARPHIFTLLLLSISVWMIEADRRAPSNRIWLLVPLTVVWTNLHGGFLALIAVLGLTAVGIGDRSLATAGRVGETLCAIRLNRGLRRGVAGESLRIPAARHMFASICARIGSAT